MNAYERIDNNSVNSNINSMIKVKFQFIFDDQYKEISQFMKMPCLLVYFESNLKNAMYNIQKNLWLMVV